MKVKIQKWGHSLAIRIPSAYAKDIGITNGTLADIQFNKYSIIIKPIRKKYKLEMLLKGINRSNIHSEFDTGSSSGNEAW